MASKRAAWLVNYPPCDWTVRYFTLQPAGSVVPLRPDLHWELTLNGQTTCLLWAGAMVTHCLERCLYLRRGGRKLVLSEHLLWARPLTCFVAFTPYLSPREQLLHK